VKGRRGLVSPKKGKSDSPKKRQRSSSPRKGRVVMSEMVFNPTPITQFNPVTNEVLNDNVKLDVMTEDAVVKENQVSVNEKLAAVVKDPLKYNRSVKGKSTGVMNKLSLGKSNVPVAKDDVVKSSVDKEALVDKVRVLSVTKTNVLTQLETAPFYVVVFSLTKTTTMTILDNSPGTYDSKYKDVCDLLKKLFSRHLKLYGHPRHATVARVKHTIPKLKWKTKENFYDCGIFTMLHMENFNGGPASDFDCGLPVESQLQLDILRRLRFKFATKILLHEINLQSEKMVEFAKEFDKKGPSEKISIIIDAINNREERDRIDN
ncbi:ulp1 protease family, C-terminal catalytic domain-containing protein, partial [Tanacetum coccineum]